MALFLTILQGFIGFAFVMAGGMKLAQPKEKVIASGGKWAEDFAPNTIKLIGAGEFACGLAVAIPHFAMGTDGWFTTVGAAGICVFMLGAMATHFRRKEYPFIAVNTVLFAIAATVGLARCGCGTM